MVACAMARVLTPPSAWPSSQRIASPLVAAIPHRHTNRSPCREDRDIPIDILRQLSALASDEAVRLIWITDPAARRDIPGGVADAARGSESAPQPTIGRDALKPRGFVTCVLWAPAR